MMLGFAIAAEECGQAPPIVNALYTTISIADDEYDIARNLHEESRASYRALAHRSTKQHGSFLP